MDFLIGNPFATPVGQRIGELSGLIWMLGRRLFQPVAFTAGLCLHSDRRHPLLTLSQTRQCGAY